MFHSMTSWRRRALPANVPAFVPQRHCARLPGKRRASAILLLILLTLLSAGCSRQRDPLDALAEEIAKELSQVQTVQGHIDISYAPVVLNQEFWWQRPSFLRTETEAGPGAFKGAVEPAD